MKGEYAHRAVEAASVNRKGHNGRCVDERNILDVLFVDRSL